jgi:hypothetical protein
MGYGYVDEKNEPQVTNGLLEGGIVAIYYFGKRFVMDAGPRADFYCRCPAGLFTWRLGG